jgi:hypothetical protein
MNTLACGALNTFKLYVMTTHIFLFSSLHGSYSVIICAWNFGFQFILLLFLFLFLLSSVGYLKQQFIWHHHVFAMGRILVNFLYNIVGIISYPFSSTHFNILLSTFLHFSCFCKV